jgi:hypothetical protein
MRPMVKTQILRTLSLSCLTAVMLLTSCVENSGLRGKITKAASTVVTDDTPVDETPATVALQSVKVELSHLVDPFDGTYKKKVTIPKNYKGNIYLAGLNVSALSGKLVKVRFYYGADRQPIVLDATVSRAPGIIPQTDVQVLVVNMNSRPFSKMRLGYDLFDYTDYDIDSTKEPVSNPRDSGLYCRGLQVDDDPSATNSGSCSLATDKCLYTYAKITDTTLYNATTDIANIPSRPQVWTQTSVRTPTVASSLATMCLPDSNNKLTVERLFTTTLPSGLTYPANVLGMNYKGPYRAINTEGWGIKSDAIFNTSKKGLFEIRNSLSDLYTGYRSLMFPRAGRLDLQQDVRYMGSSDRFGITVPRAIQSLNGSVTPDFVDGCNIRALNYNTATAEGISSCNVNGSIEVFYVKDNVEVKITTDKSIKLQVIRASTTDSEGKEVLNSAFKRCETSSTCGTGECCFNSRCWSNDLVSQCVDTTPVFGNQEDGAACGTDYECGSLCCNTSRGTCSPHSTTTTPNILCNKSPNETCVSREFCAKSFVTTCRIVKKTLNNGVASCEKRCSPVETYGTCNTSGKCVPPVTPPDITFDPANPDCTNAVDP